MKVRELFEDDGVIDPHAMHDLFSDKNPDIKKINNMDEFVERIQTNCSQIVDVYRKAGGILFRGLQGTRSMFSVQTAIRADRKPVDMSASWHEDLHKAFLDYGLTATRKNSIFCTTDDNVADSWGKAYIIFPFNGWKATAFKESAYEYSFHKLNDLDHEVDDNASAAEKYEAIEKVLMELDAVAIESPGQLIPIIEDGYKEVLISGSSYIAMRLGPKACNDVLKKLGIEIKISAQKNMLS